MIQPKTILQVLDNSGAKAVKCIKILGGLKKKYGVIGDYIIISVQQLRNKSKATSKVKKKEIYKALIVKTKTKIRKNTGFEKLFTTNAVVLLNKQKKLIGTRILTSMSDSLNKKKLQKITNISLGIV